MIEKEFNDRIYTKSTAKRGHVDILHGDFTLKIEGWTFCMVEPAFSAHGR